MKKLKPDRRSAVCEVRVIPAARLLAAVGLIGLLVVLTLVAPRKDLLAAPERPEGEPDAVLAFSLDEKAAMAERQAQARTAGRENPAPRDLARVPDLPQMQNPTFREGIIEGEPGPFYSGEFRAINLWQKETQAGYLQVYAGAVGDDPAQGALVLLHTPFDFSRGEEAWHLTPERNGALRVIGAVEGGLQVEALDGTQYLFDLGDGTLQEIE